MINTVSGCMYKGEECVCVVCVVCVCVCVCVRVDIFTV